MRIVVPAVDYADMLATTIPAWRRLFPSARLTIVTAHHDRRTIALARELGAGLVVTAAWYRGGRAFDKAAALDEAFDFPTCEPWELCIAIDADVYPFGRLELEALRAGVLYGCDRLYCESPAILERQIARPAREELDRMTAGRRGAGYFQAFRARRDLSFGSFPTAGFYDLAFHRHFAGGVESLEGFYVLHLGRKSGKNWHGRRTLPRWGVA